MLLIGSRIQEYRKKAGLNQEEFAEKMGVSRQAVSKWERDKAYPDLDRLVCICEILDVQVGELIYGKGDEPEAPEEVSGDGTSANNAVHLKNLRGKGQACQIENIILRDGSHMRFLCNCGGGAVCEERVDQPFR